MARRARHPARRRSAARSRPTSSRSSSRRRSGSSRPSRRCGLVVDMIEWCCDEMPRWHPVSISGYHIREAGATAAQELAFTLADGFAYVEACVARGLAGRSLRAAPLVLLQRAPRLLRGDRQVPRGAPHLGARAARALRRARGALAADALPRADGGRVADRAAARGQHRAHRRRGARRACSAACQSLHTNSFDEAMALPTEAAATLALRTQQVIAHEVGVTSTSPIRSAARGTSRRSPTGSSARPTRSSSASTGSAA